MSQFNPYKHNFLAIDQYGNNVWIERYPRKELLAWAGGGRITKTFLDSAAGKSYHIGYCIKGHWFDIRRVSPFKSKPEN